MRRGVLAGRLIGFVLMMGITKPVVATADEIVVPDDFLTIQAAIDFAQSGDRILVRHGTYRENLLVLGKSIHIEAPEGPDVTIIDGRAPTRPDTLSVVTVIGVEDFVCAGFTITNGLGGIDFGEFSGADSGGGLALLGTSGALLNCVIEWNYCTGSGGGVHLVVSSVLVDGCVIRDNACGSNGGGINVFVCSPTIKHSLIKNNVAGDDGIGGGIFARLGDPEVADCQIEGNRGRVGGGIGSDSATPKILRTLVVGNNADATIGTGGGVYCQGGSPSIESCTVIQNGALLAAGITMGNAVNAAIARSIVAFNVGQSGIACSGVVGVSCSDVFGNDGGDAICGIDLGNNISLDPMFCADYSIASGSPCASSGSPPGCGLIGAMDVGCTDSVAATTWGWIKGAYHQR